MKYDRYGNNVLDGSMQHHEAVTHFDTHDKVVRDSSKNKPGAEKPAQKEEKK